MFVAPADTISSRIPHVVVPFPPAPRLGLVGPSTSGMRSRSDMRSAGGQGGHQELAEPVYRVIGALEISLFHSQGSQRLPDAILYRCHLLRSRSTYINNEAEPD